MRNRSLPPARRWWTHAVTLLALVALLSGCFSRDDSLAPTVAIREPKSGTTRTTTDLRIVGYAMDDEGLAEIRVDGTDLLSYEVYEAERGKRFVEFAFTIPDLTDGETTSRIEVVDVNGRTDALDYALVIDTTAPTLELTTVTRLDDGRIRVEGVARDDREVSSIRVDDVPLQFAPAQEHPFALEVEVDDDAQVVVEDSAGNRTEQSLE